MYVCFIINLRLRHRSTLINCLVEIVVWLVSIYNNCIWKKNGERLYISDI